MPDARGKGASYAFYAFALDNIKRRDEVDCPELDDIDIEKDCGDLKVPYAKKKLREMLASLKMKRMAKTDKEKAQNEVPLKTPKNMNEASPRKKVKSDQKRMRLNSTAMIQLSALGHTKILSQATNHNHTQYNLKPKPINMEG